MNPYSHLIQSFLISSGESYSYYSLSGLEVETKRNLDKLPYSLRILLESSLRQGNKIDVENLLNWQTSSRKLSVFQFYPGRVLLQDLTGVPVIVDLAALRSAASRRGISDLSRINPQIPVDLVIDHSVHVDYSGTPDALQKNMALEFSRNSERYTLLRWAQRNFQNLKVVPPATGIVHQVNIEYLSKEVLTREQDGLTFVFPDTLIGTDSHTTMANGLGILGWGVGGIEAIAAMLGQGIEMPIPNIIGVRLSGRLSAGVTATDLALTLTQMLRARGVVDCFLEYCGSGLDSLTPADRAMISNMTPENGATASYFPVDDQTIDYLRLTGRSEKLIELLEKYFKTQGLFRTPSSPEPIFTETLDLDLATVEPSLAGPRRPQDRVSLSKAAENFQSVFSISSDKSVTIPERKFNEALTNGSVVIAAITSCTNTSNPSVLLTAGLLAKAACEHGLRPPEYVKTSFSPGSRAVVDLLRAAGLLESLETLGFHVTGYGCMTCIGNSGPLNPDVENKVKTEKLTVAAVLSGNRNFEGRVHAAVKANYLASPPLVVAYALAGNMQIDFEKDPLGFDANGVEIFLRDLWPTEKEIQSYLNNYLNAALYQNSYTQVYAGSQDWQNINPEEGSLYAWDTSSTYIQEPPYFDLRPALNKGKLEGARVLALLGDSITTDHISPAGSISTDSDAAKYLISLGVSSQDFNSYGSRRGNDRVMMRGTFANIRLKNRMMEGEEGSITRHWPSGERMSIFMAAERYQEEKVPLIVIAGKEYGTGSSRDWAAKGPRLLGVKAVIAESFERIHRSNLAGMGILPLQFQKGENAVVLGLSGQEVYSIQGMENGLLPNMLLTVTAFEQPGKTTIFKVILRLNSENEVDYIRYGGILPLALESLLKSQVSLQPS